MIEHVVVVSSVCHLSGLASSLNITVDSVWAWGSPITMTMTMTINIAVESQYKQLRSCPKKVFQGFNGIRTCVLCVRAAVLYQLSYEDPYTGGRPIY